jgi:hypothetical protein
LNSTHANMRLKKYSFVNHTIPKLHLYCKLVRKLALKY